MKLAECLGCIRVDLKDSGAVWGDSELTRSIWKAVSDLSRFLPLEQVYEQSLQFEVTEEWIAVAAGTYVVLDNKPIKEGSETVKNAAEVTCVKDTDYYIDYSNGKITHISGGKIGDSLPETCTISYTKSKIGIDLSSLVTGDYTSLIRVSRVEYPVGDVPQSFLTWNIWNNILVLEGGATESQSRMAEGKHIAIHYHKGHTAPTADANGTYPLFLENTVLLAASAYALLIKALEFDHKSGTDMQASRDAMSGIAAIHTLVNAALDKVGSYNGNAITEFGFAAAQLVLAATALTNINDASMPCLTDADTALDKAFAQIALAATALTKIDAEAQPNLTDANTALDAAFAQLALAATALGKIDVTNAETALDAAKTELGLAATALVKIDATAQPNIADANTALDAAKTQLALVATALEKIDAAGQPNIADANTALDAFMSAATAAPTALAKVDTYLAGAAESTKALLAQIATDVADLRTAIITALTAANSFLDEVDTTDLQGAEGVWTEEVKHILTEASIPNAEDFLELGDDSIDVSAILTKIAAALTKIATEAAAGKSHLSSGEGKIDKVNIGDNVPELRRDYCNAQVALVAAYRQEAAQLSIEASTQQQQAELFRGYAETALSMARLWDAKRKDFLSEANVRTGAAVGFAREAAERLSSLRSYIEQAVAYTTIATGFSTEASERTSAARAFIEESSQRLAIADRWTAEARERTSSANAFSVEAAQRLAIADRWIAEARERVTSGNGFVNEAAQRLAINDGWVAEARERANSANSYIAEAAQRLAIADRWVAEAREQVASGNAYTAEASQRLAIADRWLAEARERTGSAAGYIAEGNGILGISASFISEAAERQAEIDRHMAEAAQYVGLAASDRETANMFKAEAVERRNEAWSIFRDPGQYIGDFSMSSLRQPS